MVGEKIRSIRKSKGLTITEMSERINVTSGYISQIERDLLSPSLTVLKRLADVLEIPMSYLFIAKASESIVAISENERTKVKFGNINVELEFLTPFARGKEKTNGIEVFLFKLPSKSWLSNHAITHNAIECVYVLKGEIEYHMGDKKYLIKKGDSINIPENSEHLLYNPEESEAEAICILSTSVY